MEHADLTQIKFGRGGRILGGPPENGQLLVQIRATRLATAVDLLKLATFYRNCSTNRSLADHLALLALRQVIGAQDHQEALTKAADLVGEANSQNEWADAWEDFWNGYIDHEDAREGRSVPPFAPPVVPPGEERLPTSTQIAVRWVSFSDVGLLIESHTESYDTGEEVTHHHIIGFSPVPARLPSEARPGL